MAGQPTLPPNVTPSGHTDLIRPLLRETNGFLEGGTSRGVLIDQFMKKNIITILPKVPKSPGT